AALATAHGRIRAYLAVASPLTLGIGREGLISSGKKLDAAQVRAFARALYRRNGAVLRIEDGVEPRELEGFLALLGDTGPARDRPLTVEDLRAAGIDHITVSGIDYAALVTTTHMGEAPRCGSPPAATCLSRASTTRPRPSPLCSAAPPVRSAPAAARARVEPARAAPGAARLGAGAGLRRPAAAAGGG